jgi:hypothetical protein
MANINTKKTSSPVVILLLILFWPIGLYVLYKKVTGDKTSALKNSKTLNTVGWVFAAFSAIYLLMAISGGMPASDALSAFVFFGAGGALMIYGSNRMKKNAAKLKKYISVVINNNQTSIDNIAAAIPTDYEQAKNDLQKMIDSGYFQGAYIDASNREIVLPKRENSPSTNLSENNIQYENKSMEQPRFKVVICKNCGANNTVAEGNLCECEYCGSPLQ